MTSVSGTIKIGEAMPTAQATARRQRGGMWWYWALMLVLVAALGGFGLWLSAIADINPTIGWLAGTLTALVVYSRWSKLLLLWRFRKTQAARGMAMDVPVGVEITDEAIVYRIGDLTTYAKWSAVSEVFHEKGWWIVMAQSSAMFMADRFFESDDAKRAFLRDLLAHVNDDARARSPEAVKVAGG